MAARDLSPFLKTGITLAFVQSAGSLPVCNDRSKMTLMIGAISSRSSLSKRGLNLSGPAALPGLGLWSNFISPFRDMSISGMLVLESCCLSGMVSEGRPPAFFKSCTRILARRESDRGSLDVKNRVKLLIKDVGFGLGIRVEYVIVFEVWCALLITT